MAYRIFVNDTARVGEYIAKRNGGTYRDLSCPSVGLECNGQMRAGIIYDNYLGNSICGNFAIERMNREWLWYCFHYPFEELKVKKLIGLVDSTNLAAIRFNLHLGFRCEATIADAAKRGDLHIFTMARDECRWLSNERGEHDGWQERCAGSA